MEVGHQWDILWFKTDGIFSKSRLEVMHPSQLPLGAEANPGDLRFVDINGDGLINSSDRTNIGSNP
jgi:hypothetical protein